MKNSLRRPGNLSSKVACSLRKISAAVWCEIITAIALHHPVSQKSNFWSTDFVKIILTECHAIQSVSVSINS